MQAKIKWGSHLKRSPQYLSVWFVIMYNTETLLSPLSLHGPKAIVCMTTFAEEEEEEEGCVCVYDRKQ